MKIICELAFASLIWPVHLILDWSDRGAMSVFVVEIVLCSEVRPNISWEDIQNADAVSVAFITD